MAGTIYSEENPNVLPCDRGTFVNVLRIATKVYFCTKIYYSQQIDNVAKGSPCSPTLANSFLAKMEKKILSIAFSNHPLLYLRLC